MIGVVLLWAGVARADAEAFETQPLGEALVATDWRCPPPGSNCTRPDRVASLRGVWTATLDAEGKVRTLAFAAFWVPFDLPPRPSQPPIQITHAPLKEATETFQELQRDYLYGWEAVSTAPGLAVYQRADERRTVAIWETALADEQGRSYVVASLHVQREWTL